MSIPSANPAGDMLQRPVELSQQELLHFEALSNRAIDLGLDRIYAAYHRYTLKHETNVQDLLLLAAADAYSLQHDRLMKTYPDFWDNGQLVHPSDLDQFINEMKASYRLSFSEDPEDADPAIWSSDTVQSKALHFLRDLADLKDTLPKMLSVLAAAAANRPVKEADMKAVRDHFADRLKNLIQNNREWTGRFESDRMGALTETAHAVQLHVIFEGLRLLDDGGFSDADFEDRAYKMDFLADLPEPEFQRVLQAYRNNHTGKSSGMADTVLPILAEHLKPDGEALREQHEGQQLAAEIRNAEISLMQKITGQLNELGRHLGFDMGPDVANKR